MKIIYSKNIYLEDEVFDGYLLIGDDGQILEFKKAIENGEFEDYSDYIVIPGIIDTHTHGSHGYSLFGLDNNNKENIYGYLKGIASHGVTSAFPTASISLFGDLVKVAKEVPIGAEIVGIHSEGPYLSRVGEKGIKEDPKPVDIKIIQSMIDKGQGLLKLVAIAPELPNAQEAIDLLGENGITVAYAHSDMDYDDAYNAFDNGVSVSTHTANVMSGIHHRNMGGLGACLLHPDVDCELIADGLHVGLEMMDLMFKVKPYKKWMLISDSTVLAEAPIGKYNTGNFVVSIDENGYAKTDTGRLMGSTKPVIYGMKVLSTQLGIPLKILVEMSSKNPAEVYGLDRKGSIKVGKDADFVVIDEDFNVINTYVKGVKVYDFKLDKDLFNTKYIEQFQI